MAVKKRPRNHILKVLHGIEGSSVSVVRVGEKTGKDRTARH